MASIAAFASQIISRNYNSSASQSTESGSQPLFFSFTSDNGSRRLTPFGESEFGDMDDPHLRPDGDDDDPYLRLDENEDDDDEFPAGASKHSLRSSSMYPGSSRASGGWLAHRDQLSSSPSLSDTSDQSSSSPNAGPIHLEHTPSQPSPRAFNHISLVESQRRSPLQGAAIFSLPDTRYPYKQPQRHNDSIWMSAWLASLSVCLLFAIIILFFTSKPRVGGHLPYTTLLHTVPLLTILTLLSALVAYAHVYVLRMFVKPVMLATSVFVPATLLISAVWAFIGSFMWEEGKEPTWGESTGLRLFSLVPLILFFITFRWFSHQNLLSNIHKASTLLTLTTNLLFLSNPLILALSPLILLAALLISIPFVTLIFRLLLIGYFESMAGKGGSMEWHVKSWADWAIVGTAGVWLWTWGVARGVLRTTCAGVIGAWYFGDATLPPPPPLDTHVIHSAFHRSTHTSLGTSAISALILSGLRLLSLFSSLLRILPAYIPFHPVAWICSYLLGYVELWVAGPGLGGGQGALVYAGLSGDSFWTSRAHVGALSSLPQEGRRWRGRASQYQTPLPLSFLTVFPLTLTFPFALGTYLFVAHTLSSPNEAWGAALLAGAVTALVGRFCEGVVIDAADTLWVCYLIDKREGVKRRKEVFDIFDDERLRVPDEPIQQPAANPPTFAARDIPGILRGVGQRMFPLSDNAETHELLVSPSSSPPPVRSPPNQEYFDTNPQRRSVDQSRPPVLLEEEVEVDPFHRSLMDEHQLSESRHSSMTLKQQHHMGSPQASHVNTDDEDDEEGLFPSGFLN